MILQANIAGYIGTPATVIGYLDTEEKLLYIKAVAKLRKERFATNDEEAGFISNVPTDDYDYFFTENDFGQAFRDFKQYDGTGSLSLEGDAVRAIPRIEINKMSESGTDYAISPDTTNEQVAVIALCFLAQRATEASIAHQMWDSCDTYLIT